MGEVTQAGTEVIAKKQKWLRVRFRRVFSELPHVEIYAMVGALRKTIRPEHCTRRGFKVRVNAIPFVEQSYPLEWSATGEVEPLLSRVVRSVAVAATIVGVYAALVELGWVQNLVELSPAR